LKKGEKMAKKKSKKVQKTIGICMMVIAVLGLIWTFFFTIPMVTNAFQNKDTAWGAGVIPVPFILLFVILVVAGLVVFFDARPWPLLPSRDE